MREKIVIGNWKMNTSFDEAKILVAALNKLNATHLKSVVLAPFPYIKTLQEIALPTLHVGAQNLSQFEKGAYTGEVSAAILQSMQVQYVAIGHSERRTIFNETDEIVAQKLKLALQNNLKPILCCGEDLETRKADKYLTFISQQIASALEGVSPEDVQNIIIAYEPIWAIGTGETASANQAQEVHLHIRKWIGQKFGNEIANNITILYGGSVKPENAQTLFAEQDIDGALVGGASLNANSFVDIIKANHESI